MDSVSTGQTHPPSSREGTPAFGHAPRGPRHALLRALRGSSMGVGPKEQFSPTRSTSKSAAKRAISPTSPPSGNRPSSVTLNVERSGTVPSSARTASTIRRAARMPGRVSRRRPSTPPSRSPRILRGSAPASPLSSPVPLPGPMTPRHSGSAPRSRAAARRSSTPDLATSSARCGTPRLESSSVLEENVLLLRTWAPAARCSRWKARTVTGSSRFNRSTPEREARCPILASRPVPAAPSRRRGRPFGSQRESVARPRIREL